MQSITMPVVEIGPPRPLEDPNWRPEFVRGLAVIGATVVLVSLPFYFSAAIASAVGPAAAHGLEFAALAFGVSGTYVAARVGGQEFDDPKGRYAVSGR